ncbi:class I SAM-dependent methyltransferase [Synechococcus sp. A15-28]|uniref:class I SAM-dependent methyltransferase n=1 Tax=Synechococcus sp. A15-28 TaxID=1050638 RepID=UPI00164869D2|nr:class I SAM-dependent methyltransferase [Synechococcus sp. A15-28]QNI41536.1 phycobiliprotein asparagine methyltransferase [Synechococcus sp. A15-28]
MADPGIRDAATPVVSAFYDRFPFPGDPLQDGPPPGYNWRWCHQSVLAAVHGVLPAGSERPRILDAGCGTGVSTDYLCHLNPGADVLGIDISAGALAVARERLQRSGAAAQVRSLRQEQRSLLDLESEGPFDYINSVGVLHHLDQPESGLRSLAGCLAPDGLLHLFFYADAGRWEIHRTQQALTLLEVGTGSDGLRLGRELLESLPEGNRLARHHRERWAVDCAADANFADMYLHPQETSYNLDRLFGFIETADLHFAGFSNPEIWDPARLLQGELLERARALPQRQQWLLVEQLDPDISHFEFFLSAAPVAAMPLTDEALRAAHGLRQPCLWGEPDPILDRNMQPLQLSDAERQLLRSVHDQSDTPLGGLAEPAVIRDLAARQLLLLKA